MSEVTNEWIESEICHHEKMAAILAANGRAEHSEEHDSYADVLCELLTRRAADEGAVTVEGWMYEEGDTGHVFTVADMTGMNGWSAASVAIRRKP